MRAGTGAPQTLTQRTPSAACAARSPQSTVLGGGGVGRRVLPRIEFAPTQPTTFCKPRAPWALLRQLQPRPAPPRASRSLAFVWRLSRRGHVTGRLPNFVCGCGELWARRPTMAKTVASGAMAQVRAVADAANGSSRRPALTVSRRPRSPCDSRPAHIGSSSQARTPASVAARHARCAHHAPLPTTTHASHIWTSGSHSRRRQREGNAPEYLPSRVGQRRPCT